MSGTSLELHYTDRSAPIIAGLKRVLEAGEHTRPLLKQLGEYLVRSTHDRFDDQVSPDGVPWVEDTPAVWAKKQIKKILTETSHLKGSIVYRAGSKSLEWGTNKIYARIHQEGGTIKHEAREQTLRFKKGTVDLFARAGEGDRTVEREGKRTLHFKSGAGAGFARGNQAADFGKRVTIGAHDTEMPARPYLGISSADEREILDRIGDYLQRAVTG